MTAKTADVLTAVLLSALVKAAKMEPVKFESIASADWGVVAIAPRSSASASSIDRSLTRTPAPVIILEGSKCWTPSRWIVTISPKGLCRGPVQDHMIYRGLDDWERCHSAWLRESGYLVCRLRATLILLVVAVRLAACSEESRVLKRLPEPLLFRTQYRIARVVLSEILPHSLLI